MFDVRDIMERALWTAAQTFFAVMAASGADWVNISSLKAAGIAAGASALSALKNSVAQKRKANGEDDFWEDEE